MAKHKIQYPEGARLFDDSAYVGNQSEISGPVTVLGLTFEDDDERRAYFREELRAKLPELRNMEGFPIGSDDDIINLSDPPYYTACPNPWTNDFISKWEEEKSQLTNIGNRDIDFIVNEPYAADVTEGKNNPIYMAHGYHTKVPHPAIMRYILHYTQPGDIILDAFCGTGMTGVAANMCEDINTFPNINEPVRPGCRHAICADLSPIASLITSTYTLPINLKSFISEANDLVSEISEKFGFLYTTKSNNVDSQINYVIWSDCYTCPNCGSEIVLWDASVSDDTKSMKDSFLCQNCGTLCSKKNLDKSWETIYDSILNRVISINKKIPVRKNCILPSGKRVELKIDDADIKILADSGELINDSFKTGELISNGYNTAQPIRANGFTHIHHFFSSRNLIVLNYVYQKIKNKPLLLTWFTSVLQNASKMYKFRVDRKGGIVNGTLFVPSLNIEQNVINLLKSKISDFSKIDYKGRGRNVVTVASATNLSILKNESIDYIFIDPPFGANIMYSELNSFWELWLGVKTNNTKEAIVNSCQNKTIFEYSYLMTESFKEFYRVLKPGKWITIEFSNTSASVWNSIQTVLQNVGFIVANVSALDKKQGSFKAVTTTTAVKQDLIISCFKPSDKMLELFNKSTDSAQNVWDFTNELLEHLPVHIEREKKTTSVVERSPKILYDRLISYYVQRGLPVPIDARDFQIGLRERFLERDGMFFTADQAFEYENKKQATIGFEASQVLFVSSEAEGIEWLKRELQEPKTYADLTNPWNTSQITPKKGDKIPELKIILEENFIEDEDGRWRVPDPEKEADLEKIRNRRLAHEFDAIAELASKPRSRIKDARLEALRYGFKEAYRSKDFNTIVNVAQHLPEALIMEDEELLRYYDIAISRM